MKNFAIYRMPYADVCVEIVQRDGEPERIESPFKLNGRTGFVVAPFTQTADEPIVLIRPDEMRTIPIEEADDSLSSSAEESYGFGDDAMRSYYSVDFNNFHSRLVSGEFQKIVLARCATIEKSETGNLRSLFMRACRLYPRVFVALVSTSFSGTWLIASPEILLEGDGSHWHTMALAGTMTLGNLQWSDKNICEQAYVTSYITECIERFTNDFSVEGPYSVRAGQLVHLRTDFHFNTSTPDLLGKIVAALHPTPAVCGIPKDSTHRFIISNEHTPRSYYSGFMGPLDIAGSTHLYVSLRCMQITADSYRLFAGGGILSDSIEQQEWDETEEKMKTMKRLFY
ncbi:MAG: chorismate-binding protein [Prevotella sp.]